MSVGAKNVVVRMATVMTVAGAALVSVSLTREPIVRAQSAQRAAPPKVRLPDEAAGIDGVVGALISVYDQLFKSVVKPWSFMAMRTSGEPVLTDREASSTIPGISES